MPRPPGGTGLNRRAVLGSVAATVAAASLFPSRLLAQAAKQEVTAIKPGLFVVSGLGGNILARSGADGVILVDSGDAAHADALAGAIEGIAGTSGVRTLFNTHWHLDQIGGNAMIRAQGADVIAHEKTYQHLATPRYLPDQDRYLPSQPEAALPTERFYDDGAIELDDETVRYAYLLEAHTDGDIYVRFDRDNVIAAGGAISPVRDPELDWYGGGWLGGRLDSLKRLLEISDSSTRFVPSYGPVVDRSYVQAELDLMSGLYDILWERIRAGESAEDIYDSGRLDALPRRFDDPMKLLYDAQKSMWAHYNTLSPDIV